MPSSAPIISRTPLGEDAVKNRLGGLSLIARRILLLIDGKKTLDELACHVRSGEIDGVLYELQRRELISFSGVQGITTDATANPLNTARQRLAGPIDPARLPLLKQAALRGLSNTRGLHHNQQAQDLITELQEVRSVEEFRGVFAAVVRLIEREVGIDRVHEIEDQVGALLT